MTEKGYVQFTCRRDDAPAPAGLRADELCRWRDRLHDAGLIGIGPDGIGFGNASVRVEPGTFLITGTATGALPRIRTDQLTEVVAWDIAANSLRCRGPVVASSEALSHAALYEAGAAVGAVVHVHHARAWARLRGRAPTTAAAAEAGTPAMARAIRDLLPDSRPAGAGLIVMGGHPDGLLAFGPDLEAAARAALQAAQS